MDRRTGIDLGTSNTRICVRGRGIIYNEPTAVVFSADGEVLSTGNAAKRLLGKEPPGKEATSPLKGGVISSFEDTVEMLSSIFSETKLRGALVKPKIAISVPIGITEVERNAFDNACVASGGRDLFMLISQPMAAAAGCGTDILKTRGRLICDMGGGNTQTSVISYRGLVASSMVRTGGDDLDEAVIRYVKDVYNVAIGKQTAERVKLAAGSAHRSSDDRECDISGRNLLTGQVVRVVLRSGELREAVAEALELITESIKSVLEATPPGLSSDVFDSGITLCGGCALLPGMDMYLEEKLGLTVHIADKPLECVCRGTGSILEAEGELLEVVSVGDDDRL